MTGNAVDPGRIGRRDLLRMAGVTGAALGLGACSGGTLSGGGDGGATATASASASSTGGGGGGAARTIRLGYVSPQTGPLAGFGEADDFILDGVREAVGSGIDVGGTTHPLEIIVRDSQSDPNRAADVAADLISADGIDMMLVSSTPETTNPVSDQCEANGVPCLSTVAPWQPWFIGRGGDPTSGEGFAFTYHFFWGLEDIIAVFLDMWSQVDNNGVVGALWPNDGDGNAWSDAALGFPPPLQEAGYTIIDPGRYENASEDFSAQIAAMRDGGAEIVTGVPIPPDFTTFWNQAAQQGLRPRIASVGKALLFPSSVEALGELGDGVSTEVWWSPEHPFASSLTGTSCRDLANGYQESTGRQWTQPIGFVHALFEVAADTFRRAGDVDDPQAIVDALAATELDTIVGPLAWGSGPVPNVAKTPLVGGQWGPGESGAAYDLTIVSNSEQPDIPVAGELRPL